MSKAQALSSQTVAEKVVSGLSVVVVYACVCPSTHISTMHHFTSCSVGCIRAVHACV